MKEHSCYENINNLEIKNSSNNDRVEGIGKCQVCDKQITVEFIADLYITENGVKHYINS